jgi:hypothetical protein
MISRPGQPPHAVFPLFSRAEWMEPGYLVFAREGALFAQRFDPDSAKASGPQLPIAPAVDYFLSTGWADFTARAGTLAYHSPQDVLRLTWFDRSGRALGSLGNPGRFLDLQIAPDGKRVLFARARPAIGTFDLWMFDLARGVETAVTSEPTSEFAPLWLPDGKSMERGERGCEAHRVRPRDLSGLEPQRDRRRSCRLVSPRAPKSGRGSSGRPRRSRSSRTRTSVRSTTWATRTASSTW